MINLTVEDIAEIIGLKELDIFAIKRENALLRKEIEQLNEKLNTYTNNKT